MAGNSYETPPVTTTSTTTTTSGPLITTTSYTTGEPHTTTTSNDGQPTTVVHPTITTTHQLPLQLPLSASTATQTERRPSIRIRRQGVDQTTETLREEPEQHTSRRRSSSEPQHPQLALHPQNGLEIRRQVSAAPLQTLHEEDSGLRIPQLLSVPPPVPPRSPQRPSWGRQLSSISLRARPQAHEPNAPEYDAQVVDVLDVIGKVPLTFEAI